MATLNTMSVDVLSRLGDSDGVHWTTQEIKDYIVDALYTFGAIGNYWKKSLVCSSTPDQVYYDIGTIITNPPNMIDRSLTVNYIVNLINHHMIESLSDASPISECFSLSDILVIIRNKINEMQLAAGLIVTKQTYPVSSPPINGLVLDSNTIEVLRVVFRDDSNTAYILWQDSEDTISASQSNFKELGIIPRWFAYLLGDTEYFLSIFPPANVNGELDLLVVQAQTTLVDTASLLILPNNIIPYIRWGVLYELFNRDGRLQDKARAGYCLKRWQEGIMIAQQYTAILKVYVNDKPAWLDSVSNIDKANSNWMRQTAADTASYIGLIGNNIFMPNKVPSANTQSWTFTTVINAPIPTSDDETLQIKDEYYDTFIAYVYHLAQVKDGFSEITRTNHYMENFIQAGIQYNDRMNNKDATFSALLGRNKIEDAESGRMTVENPYNTNGN